MPFFRVSEYINKRFENMVKNMSFDLHICIRGGQGSPPSALDSSYYGRRFLVFFITRGPLQSRDSQVHRRSYLCEQKPKLLKYLISRIIKSILPGYRHTTEQNLSDQHTAKKTV